MSQEVKTAPFMYTNKIGGKFAIFLCDKCSQEKNEDIVLEVEKIEKDNLKCYYHMLICPICKFRLLIAVSGKLENLGLKKIKEKKQKV
jgi:hypothetical protein